MRPVVAFLLMFFLSSSFVPAAFGQDAQNKHMNHFHSIDEFRSFVRKHSVSRLTDYVLREVSYFKLFDDVELNLYRRDHEPTMECISSSRLQFAQRVAKLLKQEKLTSKDSFKQLYDNWILQLKKEIESIPFSKDDIQSNTNEFYDTREINGPCVNMDFEEGTFNGWELRAGKQPGNAPYGVNNINPIAPGTQHTIMNGGNDPIVGIPRVNPDGGQYSARLGNGNSSNSDVAILRQVYQVDATNSLFTYSYAIVVEEPGHTLNEQPYFVIRMFDQAGNNIPCGSYSVQSTASNPDFIAAPNSVLYQPWKTAFAPLDAYVGQNVTIEFRVADCSQGGHYGYAYVDASCSPFELVTPSGEPFICQGQPLVITAPAGANSYLWNTGATTQSITVTSGGYYEVQMIPITGAACAITSGIQIDEAPNPVANFSVSPGLVCQGESITFTDNSTVSSGYIEFWQWNFGDGVVTQSANGQITNETNTTGTYDNPIHEYQQAGNPTITLTVTTNAGCTAQATNTVAVVPAPSIQAGPDLNLCPGDAFTPSAQGGVTYVWDNDGQQTNLTYTVTGMTKIGSMSIKLSFQMQGLIFQFALDRKRF
jgi:PKD repeat protein